MNIVLNKYIRPAVVITLLLTVLTGLIYPGIVTALAQLIFPYQANGSLVKASNGKADRLRPYRTILDQARLLPRSAFGDVERKPARPSRTLPTTRLPRIWANEQYADPDRAAACRRPEKGEPECASWSGAGRPGYASGSGLTRTSRSQGPSTRCRVLLRREVSARVWSPARHGSRDRALPGDLRGALLSTCST